MTDDRSSTDAVTNAPLFARFNIVQYVRWLSDRSTTVNDALPQFLHEFTHHWCFDSLVGSAIAMVRMRAQRHTFAEGDKNKEQILGDTARAYAAEMVLRPFAEGMALFAEFDIVPGKGKVYSRTATAALFCFGFALEPGDQKKWTQAELILLGLLQTMRRRTAMLKRKTGVHAMPFEYEDGYLSGYLSVKSMWAELAAQSDQLQDQDTFLAFLRSWIYDDPVLADIILTSSGAHPLESLHAIAQRVHQRFAQLFKMSDLAAMVDRWAIAVDSDGAWLEALGSSQEAADAVWQKIQLLCHDDMREEGTLKVLAQKALDTLGQRKYVIVGRLRSKVTCANGRFHIHEADANFDQGDLPMDDGEYEGDVYVVFPSRLHCLLICLVTDETVFLLRSYGDIDDLDREEFISYLLNQESDTSFHQIVSEAFAALEGVRFVNSLLDSKRNAACENIYAKLATLHTTEPDIEDVLARLRSGGILAVVDDEFNTVRALAAIGLANTAGSDAASLMIVERLLKLDEGSVDAAIETATQRHGMRLLLRGTKYGGAIALV